MSAKRKKHEEHEEHENHERWLVSYADMITLLMVFFIVLFAMSTLDASKYRAIAQSLSESLGGGPQEVAPISPDAEPTIPEPTPGPSASSEPSAEPGKEPSDSEEKTPDEIAEELKKAIASAGLANDVKVEVDERGVVLLLTNSLLFDQGRAEILPAGREVLRKLTPLVLERNKPLIVEGHTDSTPISTSDFPSNWELSTTRATNVLRFLLVEGVEPDRLTAAGYADTHPREGNASSAGRLENRRVELILVIRPGDPRDAVAYRSTPTD